MLESSFTGGIRTILIIVGVIVILRFLGQLMNAKRNMAEQDQLKERERVLKSERDRTSKNLGKTNVIGKNKGGDRDVEDVDYEEIID